MWGGVGGWEKHTILPILTFTPVSIQENLCFVAQVLDLGSVFDDAKIKALSIIPGMLQIRRLGSNKGLGPTEQYFKSVLVQHRKHFMVICNLNNKVVKQHLSDFFNCVCLPPAILGSSIPFHTADAIIGILS